MPTAWNLQPGVGGTQVLDALQVGESSGSTINGIQMGTATVDPASIATVSQGAPTFTLTGAKTGDIVLVVPPSTFDPRSALAGARVTADNTVTIYINNPSAGASDSASGSWQYVWFKMS